MEQSICDSKVSKEHCCQLDANHCQRESAVCAQGNENSKGYSTVWKRLCGLPFWNPDVFRVNKPLIPLKISFFLWFGGCAIIQAYQMVFFKQRGLTIAQLSFINIVTPAVQCFGPVSCGLIADKIGKSKPIFLTNFVLVLVLANSMMFVPYVRVKRNGLNGTLAECRSNNTEALGNVSICTLQCPTNVSLTENVTMLFRNGCEVNNDHRINNRTPKTRKMHFHNNTVYLISQNCSFFCNLTGPIDDYEDNSMFVFILSLVLLVSFSTCLSNGYRFMDVTCMSMVSTYKSDFGRGRIWAVIGTMVLMPLSGYLIQMYTLEDGTKSYLMSFYMFDVLIVMNMIAVWKLDVEINPPGKKMWKKTLNLLKNSDMFAFALAVLVLGTNWGFNKNYTNLYLDELGATSMIFSLLPAVSSVVALPFLLTSNWWVEKIGTNNLLLIGFGAYVVKSVGYSFVVNPWFALVYEITGGITYHMVWVAIVRHSHQVAPEGLTVTVIGTSGGIHYGLGSGTGSMIGGLIMSKYDGRSAYRVLAYMSMATAVFYFAFLHLKKIYRERQIPKSPTGNGVELNAGETSGNFVNTDVSSSIPTVKATMP